MPETLDLRDLPMYNHEHIKRENYSSFIALKPHQAGTQRHLIGPVRVLAGQLATLCIVRSRHRVAQRLIGRRRNGKPVRYTKYTIHSTSYAVANASWHGGIVEIAAYSTLAQAAAALKNHNSTLLFQGGIDESHSGI